MARERFSTCIEAHPTHANVVANAVTFHDSQDEFDRSLEIVEVAYAGAPSSRTFRIALTERLLGLGRADEAEAILAEATKLESVQDAAGAWADLARHYQGTLEFRKAAEAAGKARERGSGFGNINPNLLLIQADALMFAGDLDEALALTDEMTTPAHREAIRARVYQKRGDCRTALTHFDRTLELWPNNGFARYHAAECHEALGQIDEAIEAFRYAVRIERTNTDAAVRLARIYILQGSYADANYFLNMSTQRGALPSPESILLRIRLFAILGKLEQVQSNIKSIESNGAATMEDVLVAAAEGFQLRAGAAKALEFLMLSAESIPLDLASSENTKLLREIIRLSTQTTGASSEAATRKLADALTQYPDSARLQAIEGLRRELIDGDQIAARESYQRALELDASHVEALNGLGRLVLEDEPERALELFERAVDLDPDSQDAALGASRALLALGRAAEANARLVIMVEKNPYDSEIGLELARLQVSSGQGGQQTLLLLNRAYRFGRAEVSVLESVSELYSALDMPEQAAAAAAAAARLRSAPARLWREGWSGCLLRVAVQPL